MGILTSLRNVLILRHVLKIPLTDLLYKILTFVIGEALDWNLHGTTITIHWTDIFKPNDLLYHIYMGGSEGAADYVIAMETKETSLSFTSHKLVSPTTVHCVITAVKAAGTQVTYRETLYL